ncbi:MAG TPA: hypothetical protein VFX98_01065 [Longimicrobiaceae bacterium]|nr:hypothetical protein [Longimicrobiaceae bacterium]
MKSSALRQPSDPAPTPRASLRVLEAADRPWGGEDFGLQLPATETGAAAEPESVAAGAGMLGAWAAFAAALLASIALFFAFTPR